jgi:hypothetical protein
MWADLSYGQGTPPVHVSWPFTVAGHTTCPCELTFHIDRAHHLCNSSFVPFAMILFEGLPWAFSSGFLTVPCQNHLAGTALYWEWGAGGCDWTVTVQVFWDVIQHDTVLLGKQFWCLRGTSCLYLQSQIVQVKVQALQSFRMLGAIYPATQRHTLNTGDVSYTAVRTSNPVVPYLPGDIPHDLHKGSFLQMII